MKHTYPGFTRKVPFVHPEPPPVAKVKILLLSGIAPDATLLDRSMYPSMSKQYYAARHGYKYVQVISSQFVPFYTMDLFEQIQNGASKSGIIYCVIFIRSNIISY